MKYSIGIDFGTLSCRALLCEVATGNEIATAVENYPHAVMDEYLPGGEISLPPDWALQHPGDYLEVLGKTVRSVLKQSGVAPEMVIGVSVDFTACTMIPILSDGTPLCFLEEYKENPHAYVKLWKHHAAQKEATLINELAEKEDPKRLARYGGKVSSEWMFAKAWQILNEAPDIYARADKFIEAGDWIVMMLTGNERRNACAAGYKAMWHKAEGYPSKAFLAKLDKRLENIVDEKGGRDSGKRRCPLRPSARHSCRHSQYRRPCGCPRCGDHRSGQDAHDHGYLHLSYAPGRRRTHCPGHGRSRGRRHHRGLFRI